MGGVPDRRRRARRRRGEPAVPGVRRRRGVLLPPGVRARPGHRHPRAADGHRLGVPRARPGPGVPARATRRTPARGRWPSGRGSRTRDVERQSAAYPDGRRFDSRVYSMLPAERVTIRPATLADVDFLTSTAIAANEDQAPAARRPSSRRTGPGSVEWTEQQVRGEIPDSTTSVVTAYGVDVGRLRVVRTAELVELAGLQLLPAPPGPRPRQPRHPRPDGRGGVVGSRVRPVGREGQPAGPGAVRTARPRRRRRGRRRPRHATALTRFVCGSP